MPINQSGKTMKRRDFIKVAGATTVAAGASVVHAPVVHAGTPIKWKMVTTWPINFPGLGTSANKLAQLIDDMSGGRLQIKVYGAGEIAPAMEVFVPKCENQ